MKKIFAFTIICICILSLSAQTDNKYIYLEKESPNTDVKPGWALPYRDEFHIQSWDDPTGNGYFLSFLYNTRWRWHNGWANTWVNAPYYYTRDNLNLAFVPDITGTADVVQLSTKNIPEGTRVGNPNQEISPGYPVVKYYTSGSLSSMYPYSETTREFQYGYFECRCRTPKSRYMWPAFWLYGGSDVCGYGELDIFELGPNDQSVMSIHTPSQFDIDRLNHSGKWINSMPGQDFSDEFVTWGLKWEPNKVIWYVNNKPVRILRGNIDQIQNIYGQLEPAIIPCNPMIIVAGSGLDKKGLFYHMDIDEQFPNTFDVDYIRAYRRPDHTQPDIIFNINEVLCSDGTAAIAEIPYINGTPLWLYASESYMPDHTYYITLQKVTSGGIPFGYLAFSTLTETGNQCQTNCIDMSHYDLNQLANMPEFPIMLETGSYYRIVIEDETHTTTKEKIFELIDNTESITFGINGNYTYSGTQYFPIEYNFGKSRVIIDAEQVPACFNSINVSIQESDDLGLLYGSPTPLYTAPTKKELHSFDVDYRCSQLGYNLIDNGYYMISITSNGYSSSKLIKIIPCTPDAGFILTELSTSIPKELDENDDKSGYFVKPGQDIIMDATGSSFCMPGTDYASIKYTVTVTDISTGSSITDDFNYGGFWDGGFYYFENRDISDFGTGYFHSFSAGKFNIRAFCRLKGMFLKPGNIYRVELNIPDAPAEVKTFELSNDFTTVPVNCGFHVYRYPYYCFVENEFFLPNEDIFLYSPDPYNGIAPNILPPDITSLSPDRTYTLTVENEQLGYSFTRELNYEEVYGLKVTGEFKINDFLSKNPDAYFRKLEENRSYRIKLENHSNITDNTLSGYPPEIISNLKKEQTKIFSIVPLDSILVADYFIKYPAPFEITTNREINGKCIFNQDVIIKPNVTLVIKGEVHLEKDVKIIVEQGGELILDGGILTSIKSDAINTCNYGQNEPETDFPINMWQGIEVWGDATKTQYPVSGQFFQGRVELKNGAIIENALTGIKVFESNTYGNPVTGTTGGIVIANDAVFRNNKIAVQFEPYNNFNPVTFAPRVNLSSFTNCTFETTGELNDNTIVPVAFAMLNGVNGIDFNGNTFKNTAFQSFVATDRGIGIKSNNSGYYVNAYCTSNTLPCTNYKKNVFENLFYGIYALNSTSAYPVYINRSDFINNCRGVLLSGVNNPTVTLNTFDLGPNVAISSLQGTKSIPPLPPPMGIYLYSYGLNITNISTFNIQENEFYSDYNGYCGSLVWKCGINGKELYNNTYHDLNIGALSSDLNGGLQIKCNNFINNISVADIGITSGSIANHQGKCVLYYDKLPAGNTFSHTNYDIKANIGVSQFWYHHHTGNETTPQNYTSGIVLTQMCLSDYSPAACPSHLSSGTTLNQLLANITTLNNELTALNSNIDGGSTQVMLDKVNSNMNSAQLKNVLVAASPYLSDTVMIATMNRGNPLPPGHLKQVLVSNSPLTNNVLSVVDKQKIPSGIKSEIIAAQTGGESARAVLEQEINSVETERTLAVSELIQLYAEDTTGNGPENIIAFLETQPDKLSKQMLVQEYSSVGKCSEAQTILGQLPKISQDEKDFYTLYSILADLCSASSTVYDLSEEQKQTVETLALSNSIVSANAQAIMSLVYGNWYWENIEELTIPEEQTLRGYLYNNVACNNLPVPSDTIILLDTNLTEVITATPVVTDAAGKFVFNFYDLMSLDDSAIYTFGTKNGAIEQDTIFKTIRQWITASPLSLNLKKLEAEFINDSDVCVTDTVHFTDKTVNGLKPYTYSWSFAHGITTTLANPGIKFVSEGTYNISLAITDASGCKDTVRKQFVIQSCPSVFGTLYEHADCGGAPFAGDTIVLKDNAGNIVTTVTPSITNYIGEFRYNNNEIKLLDTTQLYTLATKSGFELEDTPYKTISEWTGQSPLSLTLKNVNMEWYDLYISSDSLWTIGSNIDISGNIYVAGLTMQTLTNSDIVLIKYSPTGERLWVSLFDSGTATYDDSYDMDIDSEGNCYISIWSGNISIVLIKYSPTGQLLWQRAITNSGNLAYNANQIEVTSTNDVVVGGTVSNTTNSSSDIFIVLYDNSGNIKWLKTYNYNYFDNLSDMNLDKDDNIIITGSTSYQVTNCITIKYDINGTLIWSGVIESGNYTTGESIASDINGNVYVAGFSYINGISQGMLLTKYDPAGTQLWQKTNASITNGKLIIDSEGNLYHAGTGLTDIIISKYNSNGDQLWSRAYNGIYNGYDVAQQMALDKDDNVYITGFVNVVPIPEQTKLRDNVTLKYSPSGELLWDMLFKAPSISTNEGKDIVVSENNNVYVTGRSGVSQAFMPTIKYSQCYSSAELRLGNSSNFDNNESDIQVINFNENTITVYPNPYKDNTLIELVLKSDAEVSLEVYTITGQCIANVYTGPAIVGTYKYEFSAKKLGYSAGTYILKATVNNEVSSYWLVEMK